MKKIAALLKKTTTYIRQHYFPTEQDKSIKKWRADNGDQRLIPVHDLNEDSFVMDVGGFHGDFAAEIYARYSCLINIFEPVPHFVDLMKERFEKNPKINIFDIGLGGHTSTETISVNQFSSSIYRKVSEDAVEIKIVNIVDWLDENKIEKIDLIKINIEGSEYELLDKFIESPYINRTKEIMIQFHNFFPDAVARMEKIQKKLAETHELSFQYPFIWENWKMKQ